MFTGLNIKSQIQKKKSQIQLKWHPNRKCFGWMNLLHNEENQVFILEK